MSSSSSLGSFGSSCRIVDDGGDVEGGEALEEGERVFFRDWGMGWDWIVVAAVFCVVGLIRIRKWEREREKGCEECGKGLRGQF